MIDSWRVKIKQPSGPDGHCYINRKMFASIICQAVCDHQGHFLDLYVGWTPEFSSTGHCTGRFLQHSLPHITPNSLSKVWELSTLMSIIPGHAQ